MFSGLVGARSDLTFRLIGSGIRELEALLFISKLQQVHLKLEINQKPFFNKTHKSIVS